MEGEHKVYVNGGNDNAALIAALLSNRRGDDCGYGRGDNYGPTILGKFEDLAGRVGSVKDTLMTGFSAQDAQRATQTANLVAGQSQIQQSLNNSECRIAAEITSARADIKNRVDDAHCEISKQIGDVQCDLKTNELETRHFLSRELGQSTGALGLAISNSDRLSLEQHALTRALINDLERDRLRDKNTELQFAGLVERHVGGLRTEISNVNQNTQVQMQSLRAGVDRLCDRYDSVNQNIKEVQKSVVIGSGTASNTSKNTNNSV